MAYFCGEHIVSIKIVPGGMSTLLQSSRSIEP